MIYTNALKFHRCRHPCPKALSEDTFERLVKSAIQKTTAKNGNNVRDVAILDYLFQRDTRRQGLAGWQMSRLSNVDLKTGEIETVEKGKNVKKYINVPTIASKKPRPSYRETLQPLSDHLFISKWDQARTDAPGRSANVKQAGNDGRNNRPSKRSFLPSRIRPRFSKGRRRDHPAGRDHEP